MALFSVVELDAEVESGFPIGASGRLGLMCSEMNGFSDVGLREEEEEVSGSVEERGAMWVSDRVWDRVSGVGDAMVGSRGLAPRPGGERVLVLVSVGVAVLSEMVVERVFWVVVESAFPKSYGSPFFVSPNSPLIGSVPFVSGTIVAFAASVVA